MQAARLQQSAIAEFGLYGAHGEAGKTPEAERDEGGSRPGGRHRDGSWLVAKTSRPRGCERSGRSEREPLADTAAKPTTDTEAELTKDMPLTSGASRGGVAGGFAVSSEIRIRVELGGCRGGATSPG